MCMYTVVGYRVSEAKKYPGQMASHNTDPTFLLRQGLGWTADVIVDNQARYDVLT